MSLRPDSTPPPAPKPKVKVFESSLDAVEEQSHESSGMFSSVEKGEPPKEYEELVQKLEGDVRMHIRVEQQMRLHIENLQLQIDDLEKKMKPSEPVQDEELLSENEDLRKENEQLSQVLQKQEIEIQTLEEKASSAEDVEAQLKECIEKYERETADLEADLKAFKAKCDRLENRTPLGTSLIQNQQPIEELEGNPLDFMEVTSSRDMEEDGPISYSSSKEFNTREMSEQKKSFITARSGLKTHAHSFQTKGKPEKKIVEYYQRKYD